MTQPYPKFVPKLKNPCFFSIIYFKIHKNVQSLIHSQRKLNSRTTSTKIMPKT